MSDSWRRYLAAAQVGGGIAGVVGLRLWQTFDAQRLPPVAAALAALYFALNVAAGSLLWRRYPVGVPLSLAVQLPQIFAAIAPDANLLLLTGPYLHVLLPGSGFGIVAGAGGLCDVSLLTGPVPRHLGAWLDVWFRQYLAPGEEFRAYGVNLVALVAAWKLARVWLAQPVASEQSDAQAADISAPVV